LLVRFNNCTVIGESILDAYADYYNCNLIYFP
jgi:hypothetical protein